MVERHFRTAANADIRSGLAQPFTDVKRFVMKIVKPFDHVHADELSHFDKVIRLRPMDLSAVKMS